MNPRDTRELSARHGEALQQLGAVRARSNRLHGGQPAIFSTTTRTLRTRPSSAHETDHARRHVSLLFFFAVNLSRNAYSTRLLLGLLFSSLDASIISTSLVTISVNLSDFVNSPWVALSYLLAYMGTSLEVQQNVLILRLLTRSDQASLCSLLGSVTSLVARHY